MSGQAQYQARCTFGTHAGCSKGGACGRMVGRGQLICTEHVEAMVCKRASLSTVVGMWLVGAQETVARAVRVGAVVGQEWVSVGMTVVLAVMEVVDKGGLS